MKADQAARVAARRALGAMPPPVAALLRGAKRAVLNRRDPAEVFADIHLHNAWDGTESLSGPGSTAEGTAQIRSWLPGFLKAIGARSLLDIPCGDAHWIGGCLAQGLRYTGGDIVPEIIERNRREKADIGTFEVIDLVKDRLPVVDVLLVRDCLIHLPNSVALKAIENIRRSGAEYVLTTTFPTVPVNEDVELGGYRPVNLLKPPFSLPAPFRLFPDEDGRRANSKSMAVWRIADI
jgi:SAM-dependent methyltransferase